MMSGDTDFNEAYATASAELAVRAYLRAKGDTKALARYEGNVSHAAKALGLSRSALYRRLQRFGL